MSGGYIHCGSFMGNDKSGSAITGVLDALAASAPAGNRSVFQRSVIEPLQSALEECTECILIAPATAERLIPALEKLSGRIRQELGIIEPWDGPLKDEEAGLDSLEAKWGKGKGWQYYCAHDLLEACRVSVKCNEPICVSFD